MANNKYKLTLTLTNGKTVEVGVIEVPQGEKGDTGASPTVDSALSTTSSNPVANKAIAEALAKCIKVDQYGDVYINTGWLYADLNAATLQVEDSDNYPFFRLDFTPNEIYFISGDDLDDGYQLTLRGPQSKLTKNYTLTLPIKTGTLATTSDIDARVPATGTTGYYLKKTASGTEWAAAPSGSGSGSAGVTSIGGKTGAITIGTGLKMSGNQLYPRLYKHNIQLSYEAYYFFLNAYMFYDDELTQEDINGGAIFNHSHILVMDQSLTPLGNAYCANGYIYFVTSSLTSIDIANCTLEADIYEVS